MLVTGTIQSPEGGNAVVSGKTYSTTGSLNLSADVNPFAGTLQLNSTGIFFSQNNATLSADIQLGQQAMNRNQNGFTTLGDTFNVINVNSATNRGQLGAGGNTTARGWVVNSAVTGNSNTYFTIYSTDTSAQQINGRDSVTFNSAATTFAGTLQINGFVDLILASGASLGSAKLSLLGNSTFKPQTAIGAASVTNTLTTVATSTFDLGSFAHKFSAAIIGANTLANGTYTAAQLNTYGGGIFSGAGTITVPEPSVVSH